MTTAAALLRCAHDAATGAHLMLERGLGYWLSPRGEAIPTPPKATHADLIRLLIEPSTLSDAQRDAFDTDANAFAISQGWSRLRIYPSQNLAYLDFGKGQRQAHRRLTEQLLEQIELPATVIKFTDENGNYVS